MKRYEILRRKGNYVSGCRFSGSGSVFGGAALPWARDPETKLSQLGGFNPFGPPRGLRGLALDGCSAICPGCRPGPLAGRVGLRSVWVAGLFWLPSCSGVRPVPLPLCSVSILFRSSFCCGWRYVPFAVLFSSPFYPAAMPSRCRSVPVVIENSFPLPFLNDCPSLSVRY